ncbi:MAG: DUF6298 domain-containing protein, partial [Isosphaeraceae bacterium]
VVIPSPPVRIVVSPGPGDDTARIQAAIDQVGRLPEGPTGFRGVVALAPGRYEIGGGLWIKTSGVVLRGRGNGPGGTVLVATGQGRRPLIRIEGPTEAPRGPVETYKIVDAYAPVGANRVRVDRPGDLKRGDAVVLVRPGTADWISALGMNRFPLGYEGSLDWRPGVMEIRADRQVVKVEGTVVTLDAPLTTAIDQSLGGATLERRAVVNRVVQVGVENLRCESDHDRGNPHDEEHAWDAVRIDRAENAWVRRLSAAHFAGSAVRVLDGARRVTVEDCVSVDPVSEVAGHRRHAFETSGQSTLFLRCRSEGGRHDFTVGPLAAGPNAFVRCESVGALGFSGPWGSWASGVLYDNVRIDGAGLALTNRETDGQGTGWASGNGVLWQCSASAIICRRPPGAHNWAIGCWGQFYGDGEWQAPNEFVRPASLYQAQLAERLGEAALKALEPAEIPSVDAEPEPALEAEPASIPEVPEPTRPLALRDGWLTVGGALLSGTRTGTTWWRGSVLPRRANEFGVGLTRFVPGRDGPGFTDDLGALAATLQRTGTAALEHHWGLWYDRRRDDHQMIRRVDSDVWPPFYEQPWARSGKGLAWDGLSRYDLERFNPWYFDRLAEFARRCGREGIVLIHRAYFQHNVIEAGAHWADFPWRPANCLQETGFPEPPTYVGGKRIFMAEDFYDTSHPVRRRLHRAYIRECLDVLGPYPNVIFTLGEEYTGPVEFARFWLDTVTEWEREKGRDVLVGLGATKDVQDAILTDPVRGPAVSVVELKYWWYAADGTLYAPEGGRSLAPRQQLREWKGSRKRSTEQSARQVREYRERHPDKALIFSGGPDDGWSTLAAGGSIPPLPRETDRRLIEVLPRLRPAGHAGSQDRSWVLAEPGRNYLIYAGQGETPRLALPPEAGSLVVSRVDPRTGEVRPLGAIVQGGTMATFPASKDGPAVLWLTSPTTPFDP